MRGFVMKARNKVEKALGQALFLHRLPVKDNRHSAYLCTRERCMDKPQIIYQRIEFRCSLCFSRKAEEVRRMHRGEYQRGMIACQGAAVRAGNLETPAQERTCRGRPETDDDPRP